MDSVPAGNLPIYEMLFSFYKKEEVSFHMPGHSRGKSFSNEFFKNFSSMDTTELEYTDDLNNPSGHVKEAMDLAKEAFGSEKTFFVTTGSTTALHAALLSCAVPGSKVIVFRDAHKSIVNACCLYNLKVVFANSMTISDVIKNHPDASCAVITRPDYYGICNDISKIIEDLHKLSIPVIVDEAHGTHLHFCTELLPPDALSLGADIVIQSAHKTTPALTPGSFLHVSSSFRAKTPRDMVHRDIQFNISRITTSSPSFLIAASLDYARYYLSEFGNIKYKELFKNISLFYQALSPGLKNSLPSHIVKFLSNPSGNNRMFDFTRISLLTTFVPLTPYELSSELSERGIFVEFFDMEKIVLICKPDNTLDDFMSLAKHLNEIEVLYGNTPGKQLKGDLSFYLESPDDKVRDFGKIENILRKNNSYTYVPYQEADGKISADCLIPYPPGIPLIFPGDKIDGNIISHLNELLECNITINGILDGNDIGLAGSKLDKKYIKVFI
jgi:arginine/lysine/ornithine decarboxylase